SNDNLSWNCGAEGDTRDAGILQLRRRQAKNLLAILFLSQGVPMILAGDEVLRSQQGNNNAYSQDNEMSWFDWGLTESNREMLQFTRELIAFRKRHPSLHRRSFLSGSTAADSLMPDIEWHGERLKDPPWHDPDARLLAFTLAGVTPEEPPLHVVLNMWWESRTVHVPVMAQYEWKLVIDTARESPADIALDSQARIAVVDRYVMQPRSVVVLEGERRTFS
ncbi:MAG: glycogen debranching enzyme, partial [Povalibacter sp.]